MHVLFEEFCFLKQDNLSFPLLCPDWNADEEMLLLEVLNLLISFYNASDQSVSFSFCQTDKPVSNISCSLTILFRVLKCMDLGTGPKFLNMLEQKADNIVLTILKLYI